MSTDADVERMWLNVLPNAFWKFRSYEYQVTEIVAKVTRVFRRINTGIMKPNHIRTILRV